MATYDNDSMEFKDEPIGTEEEDQPHGDPLKQVDMEKDVQNIYHNEFIEYKDEPADYEEKDEQLGDPLQVTQFDSSSYRPRRIALQQGNESEIEEDNDELPETIDNDTIDSDFLVNLDEELTPTASDDSRIENYLCQLDDQDISDPEDSGDEWLPETHDPHYLFPELDNESDSSEDLTLEQENEPDTNSQEKEETSVSVSQTPRNTTSRKRRHFYKVDKNFHRHFSPLTQNPGTSVTVLAPHEYIQTYISDGLVDKLATETQKKCTEETGTPLRVSQNFIRKFLGMNFMMSILKFPRIRMYWNQNTRIPIIADTMSRHTFFKIRRFLKVQDDNLAKPALKKEDKLWKIRPLLSEVQSRCVELPRPAHVTVEEMMIPFTGRSSLIQYVPRKPNPEGLKAFVMASADGIVLDFEIFQGKDALIQSVVRTGLDISRYENLTVGEAAVLRFVKSVPAGTSFYFDKYFTSPRLLDILLSEGMGATGTVKKNVIPKESCLDSEKVIRRLPRGSSKIKVRDDGAFAVVVWNDHKPIYLASNQHGIEPTDLCKRWSKKNKTFLQVECPNIVKQYNSSMGGVDVLNQVMSYNRSRARTARFTVRTMLHMLDLACVNAWNEYRQDCRQIGQKAMDSMKFKMKIAEAFVTERTPPSQSDAPEETEGSDDEEEERPRKRPRRLPHPNQRITGALHLPEVLPKYAVHQRCRREGCKSKSRFFCTTCKIYLCITPNRNCFLAFHTP